jgi:hypothetical protein
MARPRMSSVLTLTSSIADRTSETADETDPSLSTGETSWPPNTISLPT